MPITDSLSPTDLAIRLGRHVGDQVEWVAIEALESSRTRLILTAESAARLLPHLERQLSRRRLPD